MPLWLQILRSEARYRWRLLSHNLRARREARRQMKRTPKPLKPRGIHQNLSRVAVDTAPPSECLLLTLLPPEVRLQIYEDAFKDDSYRQPSHLTTLKGRLGALPMCSDCDCKNHDKEIKLQRLALLKTCRQIYVEAIPVLYSNWKFYIRDMETLIHLSTTILPQRLATIRSLHMTLPICFDHEPYSQLAVGWDTVATRMTGLRHFALRWSYYVCGNHPPNTSGWAQSLERKYLEPLLRIRGLEDFDLEYDRYDTPDEDDEGDSFDTSAEAVAWKEHLKRVVCTPRGRIVEEVDSANEESEVPGPWVIG